MSIRSVREVLALATIGIALCLMLYHEVKLVAPLHRDSRRTFIGYEQGLRFPVFDSQVGHMDLQRSWKPRVLSNVLGSLATRGATADDEAGARKFSRQAGLYAGTWLGLVFLLYLVALRGDALLPMLGTYAGVAFGYLPGLGDRIYPWDMPALFFYTAFVCLLTCRRLEYFLVLLPIGVLFKETVGILALAYLFSEHSWKRRRLLFALALALAGGAKLLADWMTQSAGRFSLDTTLLLANLRYLVSGEWPQKGWYAVGGLHHPLLLDAGLLTAFLLQPFRDRHVWMLRTIVLAFSAGNLLFGVVFEYRIWFELIPILLYPFYCAARPAAGPVRPATGVG